MDPCDATATSPFEVGVAFRGFLLQRIRFPGGATVRLGSEPGCDVETPKAAGLLRYELITSGNLLHVEDGMIPSLLADVGGQVIRMMGNIEHKSFADYRKEHPGLASPLRIASSRLALRRPSGGETLLILARYNPEPLVEFA